MYDADDREELTRAVMQRVLVPALGSIALLARLGPCTPSRGARVAMAYTTITTTAFLCTAVGAPAPYRRPVRLAAAVLASVSTAHWATMLKRVRCSVDGAIHRLLDASPHPSVKASPAARSGAADLLALGDPRSMPPSVGPLIVGATFALVEALPRRTADRRTARVPSAPHDDRRPSRLRRPGTAATPRRRRYAYPRNAIPAYRPRPAV